MTIDYNSLNNQLTSLLEGETNWTCNLSQFSAFLFQNLSEINWVGFYLLDKDKPEELLLGPFQGKVACVRIPIGRGVCGTAAQRLEVQRIADVHQFDGHIACDAASNSEIVLPVIHRNKLIGVLDIDSPIFDRFTAEDEEGLTILLDTLISCTSFDTM